MALNDMAHIGFELIDHIETHAKETREEFIIETIYPFVNDIWQIKIPKKLLLIALTDHKREHPDIWKSFLEEGGETEKCKTDISTG